MLLPSSDQGRLCSIVSFERRFQKDRKAAAGEGAAAEGSDSEMDGELGDFMDDVETMDDDAESSEDEEGRTTLGPDDGVEVGTVCECSAPQMLACCSK